MKRIASLSTPFAALIEFAIERARFDLGITVAIVTLLWSVAGQALRSHLDSQSYDHKVSASRR
jgi:hypothetical protein